MNLSPKIVIVLSDNSLIYEALIDNITNCRVELVNEGCKNYINSLGKVDVLIVDKTIKVSEVPLFRVNVLINITNNKILVNEIHLARPFRLVMLLDIIARAQIDKNLFCCINENWVYSQQLRQFNSEDNSILLTDKENALLEKLLVTDGYLIDKNHLLHEVWNYHKDTESNTALTHLYKLKQKLPSGLLEIRNSDCFLSINSLKW